MTDDEFPDVPDAGALDPAAPPPASSAPHQARSLAAAERSASRLGWILAILAAWSILSVIATGFAIAEVAQWQGEIADAIEETDAAAAGGDEPAAETPSGSEFYDSYSDCITATAGEDAFPADYCDDLL